jgi:RimJ/RimL family protein N-acetyltransferase
MTQLFEGPRVRLTPPDPDHDAAQVAEWTHDGEWLRLIDTAPARPLSAAQVKKQFEQVEKDRERVFYFALRQRAEPPEADRLLGFARLDQVDWLHRVASLSLGLGSPADRGQGYGQEALDLLLRYGFDELGLHRVAAPVPGYNPGAARFFARNGFQLEVRRRLALARDGQRWDLQLYALLRPEWIARPGPEAAP